MTREEAIDIVRNIYKTDKEKKALVVLIPELAESEDERIRIRDFMMKQFFRPISPDLADALADAIINVEKTVLKEKQKEQGSMGRTEPIVDGLTEFEKQVSYLIASVMDKEHEYSEGYVKWVSQSLLGHAKFAMSQQEKQKEQIEELSTRLNGLMQEYVKAGKDEEEQEHRLKCYQLFWDALGDSEFFKQKEQKSIARENDFVSKPKNSREILKHYLVWAENSEEDCPYTWKDLADAIKDGIAALEQKPPIAITGNDFGWIDELKHDLEHPEELDQKVDDVLKQRKGIKDLEWSEENEKMIDDLIRFFNDKLVILGEAENAENTVQFIFYKKVIAWLKSLRPTTKK